MAVMEHSVVLIMVNYFTKMKVEDVLSEVCVLTMHCGQTRVLSNAGMVSVTFETLLLMC